MDWPEDDVAPYATLLYLHQPPAGATDEEIATAQERIARDELTAYYLVMRYRQSRRARQSAMPLPRSQQLGRKLLENLGFELTGAQRRVVTEVLNNLTQNTPMLRLLQGDVGSGKTVVAAFAAIRAAEHRAQTALMAPTEILAEQHYLSFSEWLTPLGIQVVLLTSGLKKSERQARLQALTDGEAMVAVGTHALFQHDVTFNNLGLTIVDEQHRFGVHQRMALRAKGRTPHQLVMTATPIPRTLTMALYADMDVSTIDELPAGRQPIETRLISASRRDEVLDRIARVLGTGRQAYWVCTLIEDSDQLEAQSAEATWQTLKAKLPRMGVGLIHGRMKSEEKAEVMARFHGNDYRLLVATTVIEVGLDVANATLMVIENPERLGLAQLHQLRGRIGRGREKSHCILLCADELSETGRARLKVIRGEPGRLPHRRTGPEAARPGRDHGYPADGRYPVPRRGPRPARSPDRRSDSGREAIAQGGPGRCRGAVTSLGARGYRPHRGMNGPDPVEQPAWQARCFPAQPTSIISKSSLLTPHSGHTKSSGMSSQRRPRRNVLFIEPLGLVVDPSANDALPLFHRAPGCPVQEGALTYLGGPEKSMNEAGLKPQQD